jgi:hypothetical protein
MEPGPSVELRPEDWRGQDEVKVRAVGWVYVLPPGGSSVYGDPLVFPSDTRRTAALDASITLRKQ